MRRQMSGIAGAILLLGACGSSSTQTQAATGDDATGAAHSSNGRGATSGGELDDATGCSSPSPVYFAYDSAELDVRARSALETSARCLTARSAGARLAGMTDPRGTEEYNLALGERRAQTVLRFLTNLGVDGQRSSAHSLGEETATGEDESGWAQDRRVDIQVQ